MWSMTNARFTYRRGTDHPFPRGRNRSLVMTQPGPPVFLRPPRGGRKDGEKWGVGRWGRGFVLFYMIDVSLRHLGLNWGFVWSGHSPEPQHETLLTVTDRYRFGSSTNTSLYFSSRPEPFAPNQERATEIGLSFVHPNVWVSEGLQRST